MLRSRYIVFFLLLFSFGIGNPLFADAEAEDIAKKYYQGVVKVFLYDASLVKALNLDKDQGYLTRGSGFIVTSDGVLFTNKHVVEWCVDGYMVADWVDEEHKAHTMDVLTYKKGLESDPKVKKIYFVGHAVPIVQIFRDTTGDDFDLYRAEVLTIGDNFDGAMLRIVSDIDGKPINREFVVLRLGDATKVPMGEDLVIMGFPAQYENSDLSMDLKDTITLSFGRHSGLDYVFDENPLIKTDASIHEGNSGGPVFNTSEQVIGIATAMGIKTQIGLIEQINNMYYIAASYPDILAVLVKNGLVVPTGKREIKTLSGRAKPLPKLHFAPLERRRTPS
ncbi:MAG: serine protease [Chlamydiales bacterium]|nr:serine protease [Chlamydiales bacterium]